MKRILFILMPAFGLAACGGDGGNDQPRNQAITLNFKAMVGDKVADCKTSYEHLGTAHTTAQLADARFYASEVELQNEAGTWVPLSVSARNWSHKNITLLDFEDGTDACKDSGNADLNSTVTGTIAAGNYKAVRFKVGVPYPTNHLDHNTAPGPLGAPGMYWSWLTGYKFLRVDYKVPAASSDAAPKRWNIHLGSTVCKGPAKVLPPESPCQRPNMPFITLSDFDFAKDTIKVDLGALVETANITSDVPDSPPGCMSNPKEKADCAPVFDALGIDFDNGQCKNNCQSTVFSVEK